MRKLLIAAAFAALATGARAEVTDRSPQGFQVTEKVTIQAPADQVWRAIRNLPGWWQSSHSWSGDARNLDLDFRQGCLCERLPDGYARHMEVVYHDGATTIRLAGALGPLVTTGATGHMTIAIKPETPVQAGSTVTLTYDVGGYAKGGLAQTWADPVDKVLSTQMSRLKRFVETGKPD